MWDFPHFFFDGFLNGRTTFGVTGLLRRQLLEGDAQLEVDDMNEL